MLQSAVFTASSMAFHSTSATGQYRIHQLIFLIKIAVSIPLMDYLLANGGELDGTEGSIDGITVSSMSQVPDVVKKMVPVAFDRLMADGDYSLYTRYIYKHFANYNHEYLSLYPLVLISMFLVLAYCVKRLKLLPSYGVGRILEFLVFISVLCASVNRMEYTLKMMKTIGIITTPNGSGYVNPQNFYALLTLFLEIVILVGAQYLINIFDNEDRSLLAKIRKWIALVFGTFGAYIFLMMFDMSDPLVPYETMKWFFDVYAAFIGAIIIMTAFIAFLSTVIEIIKIKRSLAQRPVLVRRQNTPPQPQQSQAQPQPPANQNQIFDLVGQGGEEIDYTKYLFFPFTT